MDPHEKQADSPCEHARDWIDYLTEHGLIVASDPPGGWWRLGCQKCGHFYRVGTMHPEPPLDGDRGGH